MGLLKHLLFWPVTGPSFLTRFSLEQVQGAVHSELTDDSAVKRDLMELQLQLELGDIDADEYAQREAELMDRLRSVRRWREEFGMPIGGGPVRVERDPERSETEGPPGGPSEPGRGTPEPPGPPGRGEGGAGRVDAEVDVRLGFDE